ncbi:MAG: adenylate/guanylate cyclase domain-containing protein [Cyanobacteriota bacterium]|nr:adenylate/guanylate cyclase domain-containing protein [Cyanobacteriota bacterium]
MAIQQDNQLKDSILVIDDTPANLKLLTHMLSEQGYDVRVAPNGSMGLRAAQSAPPHLVLLDIKMPGLDGYEVCQRLKVDERTREVPVIFLSALDGVSDKLKAFQAGGADYITKPFESVEVLARVENQLTLRSLRTVLQQAEQQSRVLFAASQAINDAPDLRSAVASILALICDTIPWNCAEAWMPNETGTALELVASQCRDSKFQAFEDKSQTMTFAPQEGLPGRIWISKQPEWYEETALLEDPACYLRAPLAAAAGLKAVFGVPVLANDEAIAVFVFYRSDTECFKERAVALVSAVATQLTAFIRRKQAEEALQQQKAATEKLLLNILPRPIAERLQSGEQAIGDYFEDASVLFADIVGFTEFAANQSPDRLVAILNEIFSQFDELSQQYGLEKIKTIGDSYMVAGGLPNPGANHDTAIAHMALDLLTCVESYNAREGQNFQLRIGINFGPVVAGIIGTTKFIYDLWGDTVNVASRMESTGVAGKIHVTETVRDRLEKQFCFEPRGEVSVKGKGQLLTYWLLGRR